MKCSRTHRTCCLKNCPILEFLPRPERSGQWLRVYENCRFIVIEKGDRQSYTEDGDSDALDFTIDDEDIEEDEREHEWR